MRRVRLEVRVLVSPPGRNDRQTATLGGIGGSGVRVAGVDGVPVQGVLPRCGSGAEEERDVGADPGTSTGLEERGGLVEGEGSAGSSGLSWRGVGQSGDVAAD
jgi:hypothetical protein